jgi:hypothetical protein
MTRFGVFGWLGSFVALVCFSLTPVPALAQHGGGGGSHGGGSGGGFHGGGGGGGFHSSGGGYHEGSAGSYSRGGSGGARGGSESAGGSRGAAAQAGRGSTGSRSQASNIRPAINDGQWHSFGSPATSSTRTVASAGWNSFGSNRATAGFAGGGFRGGFGGYSGFGFRGGYGWGGGWGWGGLGFGFGWPYWGFGWGPAWGYAWNPWWYGPYSYGPYGYGGWPGYNYGYNSVYDDYSDVWSTNPPPYRAPDASQDNSNASQGNNLQVYPARPNPTDDSGNVNNGSESLDSAQSSASPRPSYSNAPYAAPRVQPNVVVPAVI